jgi:hypothetical protein
MNALNQTTTPQEPSKRWLDPVLEELWKVKRAINAEAQYDAKKIAVMANGQHLDALLKIKTAV